MLIPSISVSDFVRKIKANSAKWIHENYSNLYDFAWQSGYSCFSASESIKRNIVLYIEKQNEHHKKLSFGDELKMFLKKHNIDFNSDYYLD
jgi:hypothetical protein